MINFSGAGIGSIVALFSAPLRINPIPKVQNVDLGSPLSINCSFSGNPIKSLSWYLNGIEVKTTAVRRGQSYDVMKVDEAGIGSLGVYQCEIHDGDSSYVSATSEVQLKGGIQFLNLHAVLSVRRSYSRV